MIRIIKIVGTSILVLVIFITIGVYVFLQTTKPSYSGTLELKGVNEPSEIIFDDYGVPHIYAKNEEDAYFALGYSHAQERLFQMELISRLASGKLAELFGEKLVETDKLFRTLNLNGIAEKFAKQLDKNEQPYAIATRAYFKGVNAFVENGHTPIEFTLLGIPKREYTVKDSYLTAGVLAFGFAEGFRIDPIVAKIEAELGEEYLDDLDLHYVQGTERIPTTSTSDSLMVALHRAVDAIPVALWNGSNGWIIGTSKTQSGSVILENDTHMGFSQPAVWYEAHLEYPGHSFYGNHAAMIPFGVLGRNRYGAWGITMFENDDVDFFREKVNPNNENEYKDGSVWKPFKVRKEVIKVKDGENVEFVVKETSRGPIINSVNKNIADASEDPVSVWWAYREVENDLLRVIYEMDHHSTIDEMRNAVAGIEAPGLNVMYANVDTQMAWWAAANLPIRPDSINSKTINNGFLGDPYLGKYEFENNPQSENPKQDYLYSANNQPDTIAEVLYLGYYVPEDRAKRIVNLLESKSDWTVDQVMKMTADDTSPNHPSIAKEMMAVLGKSNNNAFDILYNWKGTHSKGEIAPTIYYALLSQVLHDAMIDELGEQVFKEFGTSHLMKRTYLSLIHNDSSVWWNDLNTEENETRTDIIVNAYEKVVNTLTSEYGDDLSKWEWGKAHTLEHPHAMGKVKPLDRIFNVGTYAAPGGMEVINNLMFLLSTNGHFKTKAGSAVRTVVSMDDIEHAYTILPTGQSGNLMSPHYDDQANLFVNNEFRKTTMDRSEIEKYKRKLILMPKL